MPNTNNKTALASLPVIDLAYAVERLVAAGKTTTAEVLRLAAERAARIAAIEAELKALKDGGGFARAPAARAPKARTATKAKSKKAAPVKLNLSPRLRAFRKVQGLYAGYLRNFTGATRERIRTISKTEGFDVAVAEMRKLLAAKGAPGTEAKKASPTKKAAKAKAVPATKASRPEKKKPAMTAKRRAQLKIHGAYIGMMRGLADPVKARIKAIAKEKGMETAIQVMRKAAK